MQHNKIDRTLIVATAQQVLDEFNFQFNALVRMLTKDQLALLTAIGKENRLYKPTSQAFISKHHLKLAANVQRSLKSLLNKGLIQEDYDDQNNRFYFISDVFFSRWLQRL
jgi:predicted transcriptional regulator